MTVETLPRRPLRLVSWLVAEGGVQNQGDEISHVAGGHRGRPGLINGRGMRLDDAALRAWEAGYFPEHGKNRPTINDLLDAIADDMRGAPRYSHYDEAAADAYHAALERDAEIDRLSQFGKRAAIYARVSTDDRGQDPENQLRQLRAWCAASGYTIVAEYVDKVSGGKGADKRPRFAAMLDDAHRRRFDVLLVWALDRLSREGMATTVGYVQRLAATGVALHSYSEPLVSTENELIRDVVLALMAALAKAERQRISERTKAGLARVKAAGVRLGRPALAPEITVKIAHLAATGATNYAIGKALNIDPATARKYRPLG